MKPVYLSNEHFLEVVDRTPLVSIDLIMKDPDKRLLLGERINEPARGKWFVPGGRIMKGETIEEAFERICRDETGYMHALNETLLLGAFTHYYQTNFALKKGISTHYVVLAFELLITDKDVLKRLVMNEIKASDQHLRYRWLAREEVEPRTNFIPPVDVHENTLVYFRL